MPKFFRSHPHLCCLGFLALLVLAVFFDILLLDTDKVGSAPGTDLFHQFTHWRQFGFSELCKGNLPLWNPHIYSGAPFMAGFQSALFYPANWLFCLLSLKAAINWSIALHVFFMASFMYAWLAYRGLHPPAAAVGAVMAMFGGAYFPHVYAGHLSNLCTMVWAPLILLTLDGLTRNLAQPRISFSSVLAWTGLGTGGVALQIFAGHAQLVYYTAIAAGLYLLAQMWHHKRPLSLMALFLIFYVFGACLAAIQLLPGLDASRESIRSAGVSYAFAAMFSFPPENLLTLLAPSFFGDITAYWGRGFLWEMSLFIGVTGCTLAIFSYFSMQRKDALVLLGIILILFILSLGSHTPLHKILYNYVPGFNLFRGSSKFNFLLILFFILLASTGYDYLLKSDKIDRKLLIAVAAGCLVVWLLGYLIYLDSRSGAPSTLWGKLMQFIAQSGEANVPQGLYRDSNFIAQAGLGAATGMFVAGTTMLFIFGLLIVGRRFRSILYGMALLVLIESYMFANLNRSATPFSLAVTPGIQPILASDPDDYRILNLFRAVRGEPVYSNEGMSGKWKAIWGSDPLISQRYAEMMTFSQGRSPERASQGLRFRRYHKFLAMFRARYVLTGPHEGQPNVNTVSNHLPRFLLVHKYNVIAGRDPILEFMSDNAFDPGRMVVLEEAPQIEPEPPTAHEPVRIVDASTDHITLEVDMSANGILVVTDAYSDSWQATGKGVSDGIQYRVVPANYAMIGVIIPKGRHRIRLEYAPSAFFIGRVISVVAIGLYLTVFVICGVRSQWFRRKFNKGESQTG